MSQPAEPVAHPRRRRRIRASRLHIHPPGTPPGTLKPPVTARQTSVQTWRCGAGKIQELTMAELLSESELPPETLTWVNVDGLADIEIIARLGERFGLHRLALEDVLNPHQRAKTEPYDDMHFVVVRMPTNDPDGFASEQLCLFVGRGFVLTFQEGHPGDCFDAVRDRLRNGGRIREQGADYLAYALLDAVVDAYFPVLERVGESMENLEDELLRAPRPQLLTRVHDLKRELLSLRRAVWPMRDALGALLRDESGQFQSETRLYLRDTHDHISRIIDHVETYRELGADLTDLYLSSVSQRLNEVMRVLTVIATIFMPLTFITSVYGMNFDPDASPWNMPELRWRFGYFFALLLMLVVALGMLGWFWKSGWLTSLRATRPDPNEPDGGRPGASPTPR